MEKNVKKWRRFVFDSINYLPFASAEYARKVNPETCVDPIGINYYYYSRELPPCRERGAKQSKL